jgi:hypothetical protein
MQAVRNICFPGRNCLECVFPDCIAGNMHRVFPEETQMMKCAELPVSEKKNRRSKSDGNSRNNEKKSYPKKTKT